MGSLTGYLPEQYKNSPEVAEFQQALQKWADKLHAAREGLFEQFFLSKATWGLRAWEAALGIGTDISKSYEFRRARIESKLRGLGVTTKDMVKNVAASFSNGEVDVIEHAGEYWFEVEFTGTIGIPPNMDDLTAAIEEIKPAHLAYGYVYRYRTWDMVSHMTWDAAGAYTWDQLKGGEL
jgi:hypothetical protein